MSSELAGKVAVVTGSSSGIGAGVARAFATAGASVVVNYSANKAGGDAVVAEITNGGSQAIAVGADVSKKASAQSLIEAAIATYGRLDILVNNAGTAVFTSIQDATEEDYRRVFDTNFLGAMLMSQAALKHLGEGASIINIGSVATETGSPGTSIYTASKGAIDGFTSVLANELGPRKIRVNSLNPGMIATEKSVAFGLPESERGKMVLARTPLSRLGTTQDVGDVAVFLASDASRWINGAHMIVAGGFK